MMKRVFLILFAGIGLQVSVSACNCSFIETFCETITRPGYIDTGFLIVYGEIKQKTADEMQVRLLDVLWGAPSEEILTIPNGNGVDCRESIAKFTTGSQYLFALYGKYTDGYHLSACGVTSLEVIDGEVRGQIAPGIQQMQLGSFAALDACGNIGTLLSSLSVLPTLAHSEIRIRSTRDLDRVGIVIYDMLGRIVLHREDQNLNAGEPVIIDTANFTSGCYTMVLYLAGIRRTVRFLAVS